MAGLNNLDLRKIDSEGDIPDDVAPKSVASSKKGRKGSASYLAPTKSSGTKSASKKKSSKKGGIGVKKLDDLDVSEVNKDWLNPDDLQPDSQSQLTQQTHGLRNRFFNEELEKKTAALQAQFDELYEELEDQRELVDKEAFYDEMNKLNYDGVDRYESSPTKRLVKHHKHTVDHKEKFLEEH